MATITRAEAYKLLDNSSRRSHSILVSTIMRILAGKFSLCEDDWELIGLLHDLDYDLVQGDMSKHGILASEKLKGKMPERSLQAIRCHDHRTGLKAETLLDNSLIFADSIAIFIEDQGIKSTLDSLKIKESLEEEHAIKPWIAENILKYISKYAISILDFLDIVI